MAKRSGRKRAAPKLLMMAGIPVNRPQSYDKTFFVEGASVLQGIAFPLHTRPFKSGHIRQDVDITALGAPRSAPDARNISYAGGDA